MMQRIRRASTFASALKRFTTASCRSPSASRFRSTSVSAPPAAPPQGSWPTSARRCATWPRSRRDDQPVEPAAHLRARARAPAASKRQFSIRAQVTRLVPGHAPGLGRPRRVGRHGDLHHRIGERAARREPGAPELDGARHLGAGQPGLERQPAAAELRHDGAARRHRRGDRNVRRRTPSTRCRRSCRARAASRASR